MSCVNLASTGQPLDVWLTVGVTFIVTGVLLALLARGQQGRTVAVLMLLLLVGAGLATGNAGRSVAVAAEPSCPPTDPRIDSQISITQISITQISTITSLAPGVAPSPIIGRIVNNGSNDIFITAVTVSLATVTKVAGSAAGPCEESDYLLTSPSMPVGRTLPPGGSADFSGALLGFNNKATNQDACQGALLGLQYVAS